ncbi:MAG TPA: peptidoglycan binding domain-containing protein, partial [Polyangiaceae bacterium]
MAKRTLSRWLVWSPILSAVAVVLLLSSFVIDRALHMHRVLRGVWVARLALSGLGPAKAAQAVQQLGARLEKAPLRVRIHRQLFELDPASIGMKINVDETVRQALRAGRTGSWSAQLLWWLGRWARGHQVEASVTYDLKALEQTLHAWETQAITDLPSTGGVVVEAGEPLAVYPRPGRLVLPEEAFRLIARGLGRERRDLVEIPTALVESKVEPGSVDRAVRRAKELLGNSATMRWQTAQG